MKVKVPNWALDIKDEGILTFVAFATRVVMINGWDTYYSLDLDDVGRMCNKRILGLADWLRRCEPLDEHIEIGEPFDGHLVFKFRQPLVKNRNQTYRMDAVELTELKYQMIWVYLLGCLNTNKLFYDETPDYRPFMKNTFGITQFHIDREALPPNYIKKAERLKKQLK